VIYGKGQFHMEVATVVISAETIADMVILLSVIAYQDPCNVGIPHYVTFGLL
jgi:Asp-tRNA(Asn)/Glu-tRNA(Gln) amidotransferase A subunit family amidase